MKKLTISLPLAFILFLVSCTTSDEKIASNNAELIESTNENIAENKLESTNAIIESSAKVESKIEEDSVPQKVISEAKEPIESIDKIPQLFGQALPGLEERLNSIKIPKVNTVGILPYPNAFVINIEEKSAYKGKMYTNMEMVSEDNVEKVLAFYEENRRHWEHIQNNEVHTFKKDADKYFRETNTLQILSMNKFLYEEIDSLLGNNAKTLIRIYFEEGDNEISPNLLGLAYSAPIE